MARTDVSPRSGGAPPGKRPSAIYRLVWQAIRTRKQITCTYKDRYRVVFPHILGYKPSGTEAVFVFQVGGESSSKPLPPTGEWRCFDLDGVSDVKLRDGDWRGGTRHSKPQACVQFVDVDVNVPDTLTRGQPLAFGSPALRPPRRPDE
jgi:hypothetical protein